MAIFQTIFCVLFADRSSFKFLIGSTLGLAFSISVILSTIGVMNGFDWGLKEGLKRSVGDVIFYSKNGFFSFNLKLKEDLKSLGVRHFSPMAQTEGFIINEEISRGVLVKGVERESFSKVTNLKLNVNDDGGIALGVELAKKLQVKEGEEVVIALVQGQMDAMGLPILKRLRVGQIVTHGIYQKDLRLAYVDRKILQKILRIEGLDNVVTMDIPKEYDRYDENKRMQIFRENLERQLGEGFITAPFWRGFSSLIKAVQVEKFMMSLILQLIVVISVINVLAFVIFLNEKKSRELFLFKALGMTRLRIFRVWQLMMVAIWMCSCFLSTLLVAAFDYALRNFSFFKIPGDVYSLGRLSLLLDVADYGIVFLGALFWLFLISFLGLRRLNKKTILQGLRREFS